MRSNVQALHAGVTHVYDLDRDQAKGPFEVELCSREWSIASTAGL